MRNGYATKCLHWSFSSWLILNNMKCLRATARPADWQRWIALVSSWLLHKRLLLSEKMDDCGSHCSGRSVRWVLLFCFHEQYNQYALAVLYSWWARLVVSFGWGVGGGKCTPAWPHPVNTLMHLRTLTSIIISLHIVSVLNKACSIDRRAECDQHPSTMGRKWS